MSAYNEDDDFDMDDEEDFDPDLDDGDLDVEDSFDEDEEDKDARTCNCGRIGGCDWSIDECYEEGVDEDALPCANIGSDD